MAEYIVTSKCQKRRMEEDGDEIDGAVCGNQSGTRNHQTAVLRRTKITKEGLHERPNLFVYCKDTCDPRGLYYAKNDVDKAIAEKDEEIRRLKRALCRSKEDEV